MICIDSDYLISTFMYIFSSILAVFLAFLSAQNVISNKEVIPFSFQSKKDKMFIILMILLASFSMVFLDPILSLIAVWLISFVLFVLILGNNAN